MLMSMERIVRARCVRVDLLRNYLYGFSPSWLPWNKNEFGTVLDSVIVSPLVSKY